MNIFLISIKISLKFVCGSPIDNKSSLVRRTGHKPLPEPMMTHDIYVPPGLNEFKWKYKHTVSFFFLHNNSVSFMESKSHRIHFNVQVT